MAFVVFALNVVFMCTIMYSVDNLAIFYVKTYVNFTADCSQLNLSLINFKLNQFLNLNPETTNFSAKSIDHFSGELPKMFLFIICL